MSCLIAVLFTEHWTLLFSLFYESAGDEIGDIREVSRFKEKKGKDQVLDEMDEQKEEAQKQK